MAGSAFGAGGTGFDAPGLGMAGVAGAIAAGLTSGAGSSGGVGASEAAGASMDGITGYILTSCAGEGIGDAADFKTVHLVPGIEYRINEKVDFVAETGIAVNDFARHYLTGGLAIYWR